MIFIIGIFIFICALALEQHTWEKEDKSRMKTLTTTEEWYKHYFKSDPRKDFLKQSYGNWIEDNKKYFEKDFDNALANIHDAKYQYVSFMETKMNENLSEEEQNKRALESMNYWRGGTTNTNDTSESEDDDFNELELMEDYVASHSH